MTPTEFYNAMMALGGKLRQMLDVAGATSFIYGNVLSVDRDAKTINARVGTEDGDLVISDISLGAYPGASTGVIFYPAVGSLVVIALPYKQPESAFVARFSQIDATEIVYNPDAEGADADTISADADSATVTRGNYTCTVTKDSISLSCSDGATIVLSGDTITMNGGSLGGLIKIGTLVQVLNNFISKYNGHAHSSATGPIVTSSIAQSINRGDIEDTNVTH